jgi:hypothetical protein
MPVTAEAQASALNASWMEWRPEPLNYHGRCLVSRPLMDEMVRTMQKLVATFSLLSVTYPDSAFIQPSAAVNADEGCGGMPVVGWGDVAIWAESEIVRPSAGAGRATLKKHHGESGGVIGFKVNTLPRTSDVDFAGPPNNLPAGSMVIYHPTSTFQGFPVFNQSTVLITPAGHPPVYLPVPLERALKLALALHEKTVAYEAEEARKEAARFADGSESAKQYMATGMTAQQFQEMKKQVTDVSADRLKKATAIRDLLRTKLAQLTPTTRSAPTYLTREPIFSAYIPQAESGGEAEALMMPNPEYFDRKVARTVPQLLLVGISRGCIAEVEQCDSDGWQSRIVRKVDWAAFAKPLLH